MSALLGAAVTVAACYALGALVIGWVGARLQRYERFPLAFILGAACLHLLIFALLALKIAYWPIVVALLLVVCGAGLLVRGGPPGPPPKRDQEVPRGPGGPPHIKIARLLFIPFALLAFFHAWAPESSADGAGYHLGLVARYFRAHGFERITNDIFASLSGGVEMLFLPAFIIGRHSAAALVHFTFTIALALAMLAYGRRIGKPWVGVAGAFLTFASPIVGIDGSSAYNDVAVAAVAFAVFYWLEIWDENRADLMLIPVGLLAGYAYAVKYTAFVMVLFALAFVAWRSRRWKAVLLVAVCAVPMIAPLDDQGLDLRAESRRASRQCDLPQPLSSIISFEQDLKRESSTQQCPQQVGPSPGGHHARRKDRGHYRAGVPGRTAGASGPSAESGA